MEENNFGMLRGLDMARREMDKVERERNKVKFKMIEARSQSGLEKAVNNFLAGDIKLVDWKYNSYIGEYGYYLFICTYQDLPSLD